MKKASCSLYDRRSRSFLSYQIDDVTLIITSDHIYDQTSHTHTDILFNSIIDIYFYFSSFYSPKFCLLMFYYIISRNHFISKFRLPFLLIPRDMSREYRC